MSFLLTIQHSNGGFSRSLVIQLIPPLIGIISDIGFLANFGCSSNFWLKRASTLGYQPLLYFLLLYDRLFQSLLKSIGDSLTTPHIDFRLKK